MNQILDIFISEAKVYSHGDTHRTFAESVEKWKQSRKRKVVHFHSFEDFIFAYKNSLKKMSFRLWVHLEYNKINPDDSGGIYIASRIKKEIPGIKINLISRVNVHEKEIQKFPVFSLTETGASNLKEILINTLNSEHKIFISHSSKDEPIITNFINKILDNGLRINRDDIFCTSIDSMKIKTGFDFRSKLGEHLLNSEIVLLFISSNYKVSEICLNEMGAAWILEKDVKPLVIPPISFKSVGCLMEIKECIDLGSEDGIKKICEELKNDYDLKCNNIDINKAISDFIKDSITPS